LDIPVLILLLVITAAAVITLIAILHIINMQKRKAEEEDNIAEAIAEIISAKIIEELKIQRTESLTEAREQRKESFDIALEQRRELNDILRNSNMQTAGLIQASLEATQKSLSDMQNAIRDKVDERLDAIQKSNEQKLDEMRKTVDEKLEKTLNERLRTSLTNVTQQLDSVNNKLGEMKSVADSVSNLNKTLSGSKTRGILGELQLSQIIEDMLPQQLFEREAQMWDGARSRVEYAVKLPGQEEGGKVYLPIDSKFPLDDYYRLVEGYETGDTIAVDESRKALLTRIKVFARDVHEKYVKPPYTTDFAVIFLPTEGLYAEAVREGAFFEDLRKQGVMLTGPTTLSAFLSSLLIGFKTLQIQKGAAEIQVTLEKTKKEFNNFGKVLVKAQTRIRQTGEDLDELVGVRTRKIESALKNVQITGGTEDSEALPEPDEDYESDEDFGPE
jgi:DNA recombination protein RmuC